MERRIMKRIAFSFSVALALVLAGCGTGMSLSADEGQLARRLKSVKTSYYEYEPLDVVLITDNSTNKPQPLGLQDEGGYLVLHEITDNDQATWRPIPVEQDVVAQRILPGETVDVRLRAGRAAAPTRPGKWAVSYRYYPDAGARRRLVFATEDIFVQCVPQPLAIPADTPPDVLAALESLRTAPPPEYSSQFPAWTRVNPSAPMARLKALGNRAGPALVTNLAHHRIRPAVIQLLADLKYRPAVTPLLDMLQMNNGVQDRLILSALASVTEHPKGFEFYSRWNKIEIKEDAVRAYRDWAATNR
jgi:hypothetical protein